VQESLGSAASSKLPRDVQKQVDAHRKAGGVQHLVELLREISVGPQPIMHLGLGFSTVAILGIWCFTTLQLGLWWRCCQLLCCCKRATRIVGQYKQGCWQDS
jgi:hypothetical protein